MGEAIHSLPTANALRMSVDVQVNPFSGTMYGIYAYSSENFFELGETLLVDGFGAGVTAAGKVGFLVYDWIEEDYVIFSEEDYGPVNSLGIQVGNNSVVLIVNSTARKSLKGSDYGITITGTAFDMMELIADGPGTLIRFDNVCETSNLIPVPSINESAGKATDVLRRLYRVPAKRPRK